MAVTKARNEDKKPTIQHGASGGLAPEGYNLSGKTVLGGVENARVENEGVSQRTPQEDEKRFQEAEKFNKSKVEYDKKVAEAEKALASGKQENPLKEAISEEKKKQDAEALKKPTAPGANVNLDNPAVAQSAKETIKDEKIEAVKDDIAQKQAQGNVKEAEQLKKDVVKK